MSAANTSSHDDVLARLADIAYQALLRRGLRQPFLDVELEIWNDVRSSFAVPAGAPGLDAAVSV